MQIHDLSMPIEPGHLRWPAQHTRKGSFAAGDVFEVSALQTSCHGFTHVDAPCHMVPGGDSLSELDLARVVGPAVVLDLTSVTPELAIEAEHLRIAAAQADELRAGDILVLRSCWYEQRDWRNADYWLDAPFLTRAACEWLLQQQPAAVAFDFPQDWTIRLLLHGEVRPVEEHVSHDVLLRNKITLIEYLIGTRALTPGRTFLCAQPLKLPGADGAPARVIAIDGVEAPVR